MENQNNTDLEPKVQAYSPSELKKDPHFMTVKDWIITWLLMMIPFANIVLPFIWAFGTPSEPKFQSRKTLAQALLIIWAVIFVVSLVISLIVGISLGEYIRQHAEQLQPASTLS